MSTDGLPPDAEPMRDRQLRTVAGQSLYFDWEGFFWDPQDWNEAIALALARESGMEGLDENQWRVIRFMREFYFYHGRAPKNKDLRKGTGMSLMTLEALFPQGIRKGARRLAGLPNPKACL
jgi:dissimilatory sulfite reductase related protein